MVPVFKNIGERSTAQNYSPVSLLSVISKVDEKLVNRYDFRSQSTADLLTVISNRIAQTFNTSGTTLAVALDISKAFDRVWHPCRLHKLKSYGISGQIFGFTRISS